MRRRYWRGLPRMRKYPNGDDKLGDCMRAARREYFEVLEWLPSEATVGVARSLCNSAACEAYLGYQRVFGCGET